MSASDVAIWTPREGDLKHSPMARLRDLASRKYGIQFNTYHDLHAWSVDPKTAGDFWLTLFEFVDMKASAKPTKAFEPHFGKMFPSPQFFPEARLNFAGTVLTGRRMNDVAIIEGSEGSLQTSKITWGQMYEKVQKQADAMRSCGVTKGDRVAAVVANTQYSITLCLATLSIGAIWSSISPDFGAKGIVDRLVQIRPTLVFADSSTIYNGKTHHLIPTIVGWADVIAKDDSLVNIIFTPANNKQPDISSVTRAIDFDTFLTKGTGRPLVFEQLPFTQPGFIFYSSGTTGAPKCILHSAGGVLLQIRKDYEVHLGLQDGDVLFQYTTTAWIMWAFVLASLGTGATIVLFVGSPLYPNIEFLPKFISKWKVTHFGTSAKFLTDLKDGNAHPRDYVDLSHLKKVMSTGSVLPADVATWFYEKGFPKNVHLMSASGGTDCACAFVGGTPLLPLHADEIQCKFLGMDVDVFDCANPDGVSCFEQGEAGELVCKSPFPSQPLTFFGKGGDETYRKSYYETFGDGVWVQGDLIKISKTTRGIQMLGRSDGVLNPSGVRFGSAEIYNQIRNFTAIEDSVCVGQRRPHDRDESVILFVKLKPGEKKTKAFKEALKADIAKGLSKRHVPKHIFYVDDIPYSIVGKKLEILVKNIVSGRKVVSNVVMNPGSVQLYHKYYEVEKAAAEEARNDFRL